MHNVYRKETRIFQVILSLLLPISRHVDHVTLDLPSAETLHLLHCYPHRVLHPGIVPPHLALRPQNSTHPQDNPDSLQRCISIRTLVRANV